MRGAFGAPYEFLWANPYQPGLSYDHAPLVWHNADFGQLVRSLRLGRFGRVVRLFRWRHASIPQRARHGTRSGASADAVAAAHRRRVFRRTARRFRVTVDEGSSVFIVNLEPRHTYQVEMDDEEMYEADADSGGILELDVPPGKEVGVRIK